MRFVQTMALLLPLITGLPAHASGDWMPNDCSVSIGNQSVQFSFPAVYSEKPWTWFQDDTADDSLEYSFEVLLKSGPHTRGLGFYLFKLNGMTPVSGSKAKFFSQGQIMAWTKVENGRRLVPVNGVKIHQSADRIVMDVTDDSTVKALLGAGPRAALFSTLHPDPKKTYGCVAAIPLNAQHAANAIN